MSLYEAERRIELKELTRTYTTTHAHNSLSLSLSLTLGVVYVCAHTCVCIASPHPTPNMRDENVRTRTCTREFSLYVFHPVESRHPPFVHGGFSVGTGVVGADYR